MASNVKINLKNVKKPLRFEDLKVGNYFTTDSSENVYIKIERMSSSSAWSTYNYNAIRLEDGNSVEFNGPDTVIKLKGEMNFERE